MSPFEIFGLITLLGVVAQLVVPACDESHD